MKKLIILMVVALAGCAPMTFNKPGATQAEFGADSAQCRFMARNMQTGYVAVGSPAFVAGAAIGNAIGNGVAVRQNYKDCMEMKGYALLQ